MAAFKDLLAKSAKELQRMVAEERGVLQDLAFKQSIGQLKNVREITAARKRIAHILTALRAQR